jgi:L-galactose dehydrogenase/L-glyceraldehyde 3-phosphate reductase
MQQRDLGRTGLSVSALGFGCGAVGGLMVRGERGDQVRAVRRALEAGISYFDTAPSYGDGLSEQNLGHALRELGAWEEVAVGTKVRLDPDDLRDPVGAIRRSIQDSLRRLGHDSVDLLQLHNHIVRAGDGGRGVALPEALGGVAEGLARVVEAGLARHAGFTGLGETSALREVVADGRFETVQAYFNALNPSAGFAGASAGAQDFDGLIDVAAAAGLGVLVIRPFAAGALTASAERAPAAGSPGPPLTGGTDFETDLERARALASLPAELGLESPLELGLRFALAKRGVSCVLVGYSDLAQLEDAIRWADRGPLDEATVRRALEAVGFTPAA